ncbi:AfsR/SARP family transcriptional regulator [Hamadaea tsunoensis]|uniref:AfsR/SARP family transcriptional regulator n=1 Tax=Hamadaea tsunoensis TaxID=53368 RepID=UPI0006842FFA|nr:AfsR/SARP family transcriptional regulator [Hamadaea tsunoensis]
MTARVNDRTVALGGPRNQAVLALLALEPHRAVPVERLVDAVWDDDPPATARAQLQMCISLLRRAFAACGAADVIETRAPGYLLRVGPGGLDADVFAEHVAAAKNLGAQGRTAEAAAELRRALALWRGPALAGLTGRLVQAGARALNDRRLTVTEERINLDLALGRHDDLIGELMALIEEYPLRERLYAHLMLALYRSGRQSEALQAYRRARRTLSDELGLEPGAELRRLEHAILVGSTELAGYAAPPRPAPPARAPMPHQLPADVPGFVGRTDSLLQIRRALCGEAARGVPVVTIHGPGGIGKTALAVHAAHALAEQFPDGQLYAGLGGSGPRPHPPAEILGRFLRALCGSEAAVPTGADERAEMYRSRLADRRVLIVLDDAASEAQVRPLLPGTDSSAVLLTSRARLTGVDAADRVDLGVLDAAGSLALLADAAGAERVAADPDQALAIADLCGRLPLALRIAGARLAARPHWTLTRLAGRLRDETRRLDELEHGEMGVRASMTITYDMLAPAERRLLRRLTLLEAPDCAPWAAAALLDVGPEEAEEICERLVEAQMLTAVTRPSATTVRYGHPELVRVFARERLAQEETPQQAEAAQQRLFGAMLSLAETAHRAEYGGDFTILHGSAARWPVPGGLADDVRADPLGWLAAERATLHAAVRQTAALGWDELCWDLALTSVTLFEARSYHRAWRETAQTALDCCTATANVRGQAAMLATLGAVELFESRTDDAESLLHQALDLFTACADGHGRALVLRNLAYLDRIKGRTRQARARYDEALAGLQQAGDLIGQAHVLVNVAGLLLADNHVEDARDLLGEALSLCRSVGSRRVEAQVLHRMGEVCLTRSEYTEAGEMFTSALRIVRHCGDRVGEAYALLGLGRVEHAENRPDQAGRCYAAALGLARRTGEKFVAARALQALGELDLDRRRGEMGAERLAAAGELFAEIPAGAWQEKVRERLADTMPY